jgi:hypothetical protein
MNPGPVEEGAKVATGFIDAMRSQPLALALVICNVMLLSLFFFVAHWAGTNRSTEFASIMAMQREVQKLLYNCTPTTPSGFQLPP